jgi:hypothetical protein
MFPQGLLCLHWRAVNRNQAPSPTVQRRLTEIFKRLGDFLKRAHPSSHSGGSGCREDATDSGRPSRARLPSPREVPYALGEGAEAVKVIYVLRVLAVTGMFSGTL